MQIKRIRFPNEGNSEYPLPEDWRELTQDGQRLARISALRQWQLYTPEFGDSAKTLRHKKECRGFAFDEGVQFFDRYYLSRQLAEDGDIIFDPMFYKGDPLPSPLFHSILNRHFITDRKLALVAMRGGAKSTALYKPMMMCMLSCPRYDINYATASNPLVERCGSAMKFQLGENQRIIDDWSPEYNGKVQPSRGEGPWGMQHFTLANRSTFFGMSAQSRQRGLRPTKYVLDDPEYDSTASTSMEERREFMQQLLFSVALPMVQQFDTGIVWVGTYVSLRHYLWFAMQTRIEVEDGKQVERAADPRFGGWVRIECPAAIEDENGELQSSWPYLHPLDEEDREARGLVPGVQTLADIRAELGEGPFMSEYMCRPGEGDASYFPELQERTHGYWFKKGTADQLLADRPFTSSTTICWYRNDEIVELPLRDFCNMFRRFICCDTSYTATPDSDWKVVACMLLTDHNELFILDLWAEKCRQEGILVESFRMADRWHASVIGTEAIRDGITLYEAQCDIVKTRAVETMGVAHMPNVVPIRPGNTEKQDRIAAALTWRMEHGLIKMPLYRDGKAPWRQLFDQFRGFNPYARDGGLEKDDHLDTVHMHRYLVSSKPQKPKNVEPEIVDPIEKMKEGELWNKVTDMPHAWSALHRMSPDDIAEILDKQMELRTLKPGTML